MTNVLILGANGQTAHLAIEMFLQRKDVNLKLFQRGRSQWCDQPAAQVQLVTGDVLDQKALQAAMIDQDVVYANLAGSLEPMARNIVEVMEAGGVRRLIFITSMGIYDEVPGEWYGSVLEPYRRSASLIEASGLDFTLLRPAWLNDRNEVAYDTTQKGEPFKNSNSTVSRKSVADLVVQLATTPGMAIRQSMGIHYARRTHITPDIDRIKGT